MAEIFERKTWVDRQSQYPNRRKLIPTSDTDVYEIERAEGGVTESGDAYSAKNMNDLETRINAGFKNIHSTDITLNNEKNYFLSKNVEGALNELFQFADSGRRAIINAIGKTRNGVPSAGETFAELASRIEKDKVSIWTGKVSTPAGGDWSTWNPTRYWHTRCNINFGFKPKFIFVNALPFGYTLASTPTVSSNVAAIGIYAENDEYSGGYARWGIIVPSSVSENGFDMELSTDGSYINGFFLNPETPVVYAFG